MVTLHKFIPVWGLPDFSPFCVKLETYLRMAEIPFETRIADPRKAPKHKLPFIEHEGKRIADSTFAIEYLKQRFGDPLDEGMTSLEIAQCQALTSMLEEHLYFVGIYELWKDDRGWAAYRPVLADYGRQIGIPKPLISFILPGIRKSVVAALVGQGLGRHTPVEAAAIGRRLVDAAVELLGDRPYYCGDKARSVDASLFAFLLGFVRRPHALPTHEYAKQKPTLRAYCDRMEQAYYG